MSTNTLTLPPSVASSPPSSSSEDLKQPSKETEGLEAQAQSQSKSTADADPEAADAAAQAAAHAHPLAQLSNLRKHVLLVIFTVATFVDVCNVSGAGVAVAQIAADIQLELSQIVWILTAYSLTFASFLLFAGRLSDLFPAQFVFEGGFIALGVLSLITSFVTTNKYGFLILRALGGVAGAMTIPSAYHLLVHMFPDPAVKRKKLAVLGLAAALGNVLGLVLSALTMLASYHWFFRLMAILCLTFSALTLLILPHTRTVARTPLRTRLLRLDLVGVLIIISSLVCLLLALTQGPIDGWSSASFIAPLVLSALLFPLFFVWESRVHPASAIMPATVWKIKNMAITSFVLLLPMSFWVTSQVLFSTYWQVVLRWRPLHVAAAALPQGIAALLAGGLSQATPVIIQNPRRTVPLGAALIMIGEALMFYSDGGDGMDYWRWCFPGFVIGSAGAIIMVMAASVNFIIYCPPEMAGVAGAWNQTMGQVGTAVCLAVQAGMEGGSLADWRRNARSFWFEFAAVGAVGLVYLVGFKVPESPEREHELARERMRVVEERWGK